MITAAHVTVFAADADAARAFFRDVLGFPCTDAGDGWLIFGVPPTELGVHPGGGWGEGEGGHRLFLICDEIESTVEDLKRKGVEFTAEIADEGYGPLTTMIVPGLGEVSLYEPTYESPLDGVGSG